MSKRAPSRRPCRSAGRPGRRPRRAPAPRSPARPAPTGGVRLNESAVSAATPPTSVARVSVTQSAGPNAGLPRPDAARVEQRRRARAAYARPVSHPATPSPTVAAERARAGRPGRSGRSTDQFEPWPPCLRDHVEGHNLDTQHETVRFDRDGGGSEPMTSDARAFWLRAPGRGRDPAGRRCPSPARTRCSSAPLYSGVSRGTETLVFRGGCRPSQYAAMRAPFQEGDFPGPVKYGYLNVGVVEEGPADAARAGPSSASTRTRPRTSCRPAPWSPCPTACRRRGPCWPARWRPR